MSRRRRRQRPSLVAGEAVLAVAVGLAAWEHPVGRQLLLLASLIPIALAVLWTVRKTLGVRLRRSHRTVEALRAMDPTEFEHAVAAMLRDAGCRKVAVSGGAGDLQADVTAITSDGRRVVVQCKRYAAGRKVTSGEMQSFIGMLYRYHEACLGIFVTTGEFTAPAADLAADQRVLTVDHQGLTRGLDLELRKARLRT